MKPFECIVPTPGLLQGKQPSGAEKDLKALASARDLIPVRILETICHRTISGDPAYYPQAEFHGLTIYFCTEACQSVFLSDPEGFYAAHSKRKTN